MEESIQTEGVENSTTNIVLRTFKDEDRLLVNYNDEDLEQLFSFSGERGAPFLKRERSEREGGEERVAKLGETARLSPSHPHISATAVLAQAGVGRSHQ
ncbi:hypothetical protein [Halegenticoccus tardaugens]|uniref:hypothetical protein n=1 Tax=Halegenticoccus tardaugens TaxID=2071624 RepID=UPI001E488AC9|nr:hypothetical protein [Halegenticoccus tardaugens]